MVQTKVIGSGSYRLSANIQDKVPNSRYEPKKKNYKTDDLQNERMHFKRAYIEPLIKKGWVKESDVVKDRWEITPEGEAIIEVYHGLE